MSIRVVCYCSKETLVPESFCGEEMTCSNCQQRYILPRRWRELGRPMLDLDLQPDEWVTIICECHNPMDVPMKYAGRRISCEECGAIHGVPEFEIPDTNAAGQDIEAVRTSIELQAQRSASQSEVGYPTDDPSASASRSGSSGSRSVPSRTASGGSRGARVDTGTMPQPEDDPDEYEYEDDDADELPLIACKRCRAEFVETDPFCPECGAHPATGLTHPDPDAQDTWKRYQRAGSRRTGSGRATANRASGRSLSRSKTAGGASRSKTRSGGGARSGGKSVGKGGGTLRRKTASGGSKPGSGGKTPRPRSGGSGSPRARSGSFQRPDRKRRPGGNR